MLIAINNAVVINNKASKIYNSFILQVTYFSLKFVGTVCVVFKISSHVIIESSIILAKYLPFSKQNSMLG